MITTPDAPGETNRIGISVASDEAGGFMANERPDRGNQQRDLEGTSRETSASAPAKAAHEDEAVAPVSGKRPGNQGSRPGAGVETDQPLVGGVHDQQNPQLKR